MKLPYRARKPHYQTKQLFGSDTEEEDTRSALSRIAIRLRIDWCKTKRTFGDVGVSEPIYLHHPGQEVPERAYDTAKFLDSLRLNLNDRESPVCVPETPEPTRKRPSTPLTPRAKYPKNDNIQNTEDSHFFESSDDETVEELGEGAYNI